MEQIIIDDNEKVFSSMVEAGKFLRVGVSTIMRAVRSGELRAYRVGQNHIRIRLIDFDHYLKHMKFARNMPHKRELASDAKERLRIIIQNEKIKPLTRQEYIKYNLVNNDIKNIKPVIKTTN